MLLQIIINPQTNCVLGRPNKPEIKRGDILRQYCKNRVSISKLAVCVQMT